MTDCTEFQTECGCFVDAAGVPQNVVIHYKYGVLDAAGVEGIERAVVTDAAGVIVDTSTGTLSCGACPVGQPDVEMVMLCDVLADGTRIEFFCRTITRFNPDGTAVDPAEVAYFELDKVTPYVPAGTIEKCSDYSPDVEWSTLCDVQADGSIVRFFCRTTTNFDSAGVAIDPVAVDNFGVDKVTPYVTSGKIADCDECIPDAADGLVTTWG